MEVNCEDCAGCCIDWRPLADGIDHEHRGRFEPFDDRRNFVFLTREDVWEFLDAGLGDALTPRLFRGDSGVEVGGETVAAIRGRPAFVVGLRKPPKPVAPFGNEARWLPSCVFLDPETLQCRVYDTERYPSDCAAYPGHNLALDRETECERVEAAFGGERLLDDEPEEEGLLLGPSALGEKVFAFPEPESEAVADAIEGKPGRETRAAFAAVAAASAPGTLAVNDERRTAARERALDADGWVGGAIAEWERRAGGEADPSLGGAIEESRGAPPTPGWG
jgi:hypothetical protein